MPGPITPEANSSQNPHGEGQGGVDEPTLSLSLKTAEIVQAFRFEAAHYLPRVHDAHRCKRMHGHSYQVDVHVAGVVDPSSGWVVDFYDIEASFGPVMEALDHHLLNEVPGLENPTAENIAIWVYRRLVAGGLRGLCQIVVHETGASRAIFRG